MDVRCDKCQARYRIDDARVGPAGLTMRCGKCGNTFKVTKEGAAPAAASKPPPAAAPAEDMPGSTMMFQAPKIPPAKPAPAPSAPPAPAAPAGDLPGSTMMFQAPKIPPAKPAPAPAPPPAKPAGGDDDAGSTMMFGTAPIKASDVAAAPAPAPSAPPKPAPKAAPAAAADGAGSTMMFGSSPLAKPAPAAAKPAPPPPRPAPAPAPKKEVAPPPEESAAAGDEETVRGDEEPQAAADEPSLDAGDEPTRDEPVQAKAGEVVGDDDIDPAALTSESAAPPDGGQHPPARKAPLPMGLIFGSVGAVVVLAIGGGLFMKLRSRPPPPAAIQAMNDARALLDKDSLASFQAALDGDASALAAAPKSVFPEAHALQAEIELAWSDALADQSALLSDKSTRLDDDKKKAEADANSQKAQTESKIHFKTAFEAAKAANTLSPTSPDVHVALADYYRAAKSSSNYEREVKKATAFKADEAQLAAIEGARLLGEDDSADKALAKLKTALAANPQSARIEYRIAQAQALLKNDAEEKKALDATLKLSPGHERAKLMLEALAAAQAAANPPANP